MKGCYDKLTGKNYHIQIHIVDKRSENWTKRLSHYQFCEWVRHLRGMGYSLSIEYADDCHTYIATAKEGC